MPAPDPAGNEIGTNESPMYLSLSLPEHVAGDAELLTAAPLAVTFTESAEEDDDDTNGGSAIVSFLPLILIFAALYFLLLRPRQRQMKQQRALQASIDVGDEVMLTSGVYGFITGIDEGTGVIWVEIDDDVQIRVTRAAISSKVDTSAAAGAEAPTDMSSSRPTLKGGAAAGGSDAADAGESDDE